MPWTIYCHVHIESGRRYIGLTKKTMMQRWNRHVYNAIHSKGGKLVTGYFSNAIRKYGKDSFSHEILEICNTIEEANLAEVKWIHYFDSRNPEKGFNLAKGGIQVPKDKLGFSSKMSSSIKKVWQNPEYRQKMSSISKEINSRSEVKEKIIASLRKRVFSKETRKKISTNLTGKKRDPRIVEKIAASNRNLGPESNLKKSNAAKASWSDPEYRARVMATNKSSDPETRAKIAASVARFYESRRVS